jgi:hypothetical protein
MPRIVKVHYVDKDIFFSNNSEYVANKEEAVVLVTSLTYVVVVARVGEVLKWMDPREMVDLEERYDVGSHIKLK